MLVTDFNYDLPQELIAQHPVEPRDHSRLLVVDKTTGEIEHKHFYDLPEYLRPGDVLVFNDTRVIPARLHGFKDTGAKVEVFFSLVVTQPIGRFLSALEKSYRLVLRLISAKNYLAMLSNILILAVV